VSDRVILLIEDNPDDRALTLRALRKNKIANEVIVASDGAEALDKIFSLDAALALVLLDLNLPKVDGLEVLRRIRACDRTRLIPVVVLTSSKEQEDIIASYQNGANAYVPKPVKFADFVEAVRTLGMFWLLINVLPPGSSPSA
jgi:two-component system, response regulator